MSRNYFFCEVSSCFCRHEILFLCNINFFLLTWNTCSWKINLFLSTPDYFLCNIKLFASTQNCFSCNTKCLFCTLFRMLCHGDIFLLSRRIKSILIHESQHKSTRVNKNQHESNMSQYESDTSQYESTWVQLNHEPLLFNKGTYF